jgi:hypothetical protein
MIHAPEVMSIARRDIVAVVFIVLNKALNSS